MLRVIPLLLKTVPLHCVVSILLGMIGALLMTVGVIATQRLFDTIASAAAGNAGFWDTVIPLLLLAGVTFGQEIAQGVMNFQSRSVMSGKAVGKILSLLHLKLQRIDSSRFEDTSFLDDLNKAREGSWAIPYFGIVMFLLASMYLVFFASIGAYLFSLKPLLLITLVLSFLPALFSQIIRAKVYTKLEEQSAPLRRENEYYQRTLCDREYFKETRILGAFNFLHGLYTVTMQLFTQKQWQAERNMSFLQLALDISTFVGMAVSSYLLFTATMAGYITVGTFAAVFAALGTLFRMMQEVVTMHIGSMNRDIGRIANFIRMLDMPERTGTRGTPDFAKGVIAENVSFTYPGKDTPATREVSLTIADGETIAIVGENGAGKSTLARLLTGIYRPLEGRVSIGGLDTSVTATESLFKCTSGVFQKFQRYKMNLGDNVAISDAWAKDVDSAALEIQSALNEAGVDLEYPLDTMLSPEFGGVDLSGGQWQRLAIARGLYRINNFIVLDEPTAAIDPIEELRVYTQFQRLAENKCAIIITHRLSSAKLARRIIVMDNGKIADIGTHDELLSRRGKYADMWEAQAQWYSDSV